MARIPYRKGKGVKVTASPHATAWGFVFCQGDDRIVLQQTRELGMKISTKARCVECLRVFDLLDSNNANEWAYGHDCEGE